MSELLIIKALSVTAEDKELLHEVTLTVGEGETHVLMGHNGAGKSTLGCTIMGSPEYAVTGGKIIFDGEDITAESADKRAKRGIFLSFQNPIEIPGITLSEFLRNALEQLTGKRTKLWEHKKKLKAAMELLDMDSSYADRDLNVGFSGGEKKKVAIASVLTMNPSVWTLDEPLNSLDGKSRQWLMEFLAALKEAGKTLIFSTHEVELVEYFADRAIRIDELHQVKVIGIRQVS